MHRVTAFAAAVVVALLTLSGCGGSGAGEPAGGSPAGRTITVTVNGAEITPNGERVEVGTGERVTLEIHADRPGELHVHSSPEKEIPFEKGDTTAHVRIDRPGIVEVEEHESDVVVVQLQVS
jgi:hypothetical protein